MISPKCDLVKCGCRVSSFKWISHKHKYIYFEIPKCGSATLKKYLPEKTMIFSDDVYDDYLKFTFVRNPWDRMVSNYNMFTQHPMRKVQIETLFGRCRDGMSFNEFVATAAIKRNHHWEECSAFIPNQDIIINKFDNFQKNVSDITKTFNIKSLTVHENKTNNDKHYSSYYCDESIEIVSNMFKNDIDRFNFVFDDNSKF